MSYIKSVTGLPTFAMVSAISIVDPLLSYPHRLVLSILALHANGHGKAEPTQDRIAALAGWFCKNQQTGIKEPNARYVSTLINNENYQKKSDRCGLGLVQLGYIKPGYKQNGFNQPNIYYLTTPTLSDGYIQRPNGIKTQSRFTGSVKREDSKVYKARKSAEQSAYEAMPLVPRKKYTAADQLSLDLPEVEMQAIHTETLKADDQVPDKQPQTYNFMGDEYICKDCELDLINWQDGFERDIPDVVYHHFKIRIPSRRDSDY